MTPWSITDTFELIQAIEEFPVQATFLSDMFFADKATTTQDVFSVEVIKKQRRLAPMLVRGSRALNMSREESTVKLYKPPLIGARRTISLEDVSRRIVGEMPVVSTTTPADRAMKMQVDDLKDLTLMQVNRREQMAASLLTTGTIPIKGFAEDGQVVDEQTIVFDSDWVVSVSTNWSDPTALIYDDIKAAVEYIAEETGQLPDVAICGRNIEGYLLKNEQFQEWAKAFRESVAIMNLQPQFASSNARLIGRINALGLELYSYIATYYDDVAKEIKYYVPEDAVIIGTSRAGKYLFGRVDVMKDGTFTSYVSENVPYYSFDNSNQTTSLTVLSRCLPILPVLEQVRCLEVVS